MLEGALSSPARHAFLPRYGGFTPPVAEWSFSQLCAQDKRSMLQQKRLFVKLYCISNAYAIHVVTQFWKQNRATIVAQ